MTQDSLPAAPDGHALFSPSASARWLNCPGSFLPCARVREEDRAPSVDAARGTVAHELAKEILSRTNVFDVINETRYIGELRYADGIGFEITQDMLDHVETYVRRCIDTACADAVLVETYVDLSHLFSIPDQGGTLDHAALIPSAAGGLAVLTDLKYGTGVRVYAEGNTQLMLYALGIYHEWDWLYNFKRFDLRICQPRLNVFDVWEISTANLLAFGEDVKRKAVECLREDAPRTPGEKQCRFCAVKATCPAHLAWLERLTSADGDVFDAVTPEAAGAVVARLDAGTFEPRLAPVTHLTTAQLARVLPYRSTVEGWFKAAYEELERRALDGEDVPGYRLTAARSRRQWGDEMKATAFLASSGVDAYTRKIISPSDAEKALNAKRPKGVTKAAIAKQLAVFTVKPAGRPVLAPVKDGRPELEDDGDVFDAQDS